MAEATIKDWKPSYLDGSNGTTNPAIEGAIPDLTKDASPTIRDWKPSYQTIESPQPPKKKAASSTIQDWKPQYLQEGTPVQPQTAAQTQATGDAFQPRIERFAGIEGFEGEKRTDSVIRNIGMDLVELGGAYKTIAGLISDDFKSGNYTNTLGTMAKNFPEAVVKSYSRWYQAAKEGKLTEAISKYPLQFAQDATLPLTFGLGGAGFGMKAAGVGGRALKAVQVMSKIADVAEIVTDPFVGIPAVGVRKVAGKLVGKGGKEVVETIAEEIPITPEKAAFQKVLEEKGYANASELADEALKNPEFLKDPDLYSDYIKAKSLLAPKDIDFDKAAREIVDLDLDTTPLNKKYIVNENISRLQTTHEMDNLNDAVAKILEKERAPVRTREMVDQLADYYGMTPEEFLKTPKNKALTDYQIEGARRINQQAKLNLYAAKNIAKHAPTPENYLKFDHALRFFSASFDKMSGIATEAGRSLSVFNKIPKLEKLQQKAIRELIDQHGGTMKIEETLRVMDELSDDQIAKFVRKSLEATNWEKFREGWMSGLMSGPTSQVVNAGSNLGTTIYTQALESLVTSAYSEAANAVRRITGKPTTPVGFAETAGRIRGLGKGMIAGARAFKENFINGESFGITLPLDYRRNAISGLKGTVIRTPLRLLESADSFFKALNYSSELEGLAIRSGVKKGLKGADLSTYVKETVTNPPDNLINAAMGVAEKNTYTNKLGGDWLTESGKWIMAGRNNKYFGKPLQIAIPFVKTPTNIMKFALERTPLALTFSDVRQAIKAGGIARDQAIARIALGSALSFYIVNQVEDGKITGALSSDKNKRNTQRAEGIQPYSFKPFDTYFSYQRLEPLGTIIGMTSDFKQLFDLMSGPETMANKKDIEKIPALISASIAQNILNKTYMQGLSGLVAAMDDPDRNFQQFYSNLASTVVPTGVGQYARFDDPYLREAKSTIDKIKNKIPRLRETLPYKFNIWGEPTRIETTGSLINPIYASTEKNDKATKELLRLGLYPTMPDDEVTIGKKKIQLDKYQYESLLSFGRKQAKNVIDGYVNSKDWETRPDLDKREIIEKVIRAYDARARKIVYNIALKTNK